jgi:hypothetical protein
MIADPIFYLIVILYVRVTDKPKKGKNNFLILAIEEVHKSMKALCHRLDYDALLYQRFLVPKMMPVIVDQEKS